MEQAVVKYGEIAIHDVVKITTAIILLLWILWVIIPVTPLLLYFGYKNGVGGKIFNSFSNKK